MQFDTGLAQFTFTPSTYEIAAEAVTSESTATFYCQHNRTNTIGWLVNDTALPQLDATLNITHSRTPLPGSTPLSTLMFPARLEYNRTSIVCLGIFFDGSPADISRPPAYLLFTKGTMTLSLTKLIEQQCVTH